ncbi:hypothetical protein LTS18_005534, partial [Coniosporium uncinatum]
MTSTQPYLNDRRFSHSTSVSSSSLSTVRPTNSPSLQVPSKPDSRLSTPPYLQDSSLAEEAIEAQDYARNKPSPSAKPWSSIAHVLDGLGQQSEGYGGVEPLLEANRTPQEQEGPRKSLSRRLSLGAANATAAINGSSAQNSASPRRSASHVTRSPQASPRKRHRSRSPRRGLPSQPPPAQSSMVRPFVQNIHGGSSASSQRPSVARSVTAPSDPGASLQNPADSVKAHLASRGYLPTSAVAEKTGLRKIEKSGKSRTSEEPETYFSLQRRRELVSAGSSQQGEDDRSSTPSHQRDRREKDKKAMLSRALQKANTAVLLDNAQNFEGAADAYMDACQLLKQVMLRTSGEDDRRKLDAIRVTYQNRIEELRMLDPPYQHDHRDKALPESPTSNEFAELNSWSRPLTLAEQGEESAIIQPATVTRVVGDPSVDTQREPSPSPTSSRQLSSDRPINVRSADWNDSRVEENEELLESPTDRT